MTIEGFRRDRRGNIAILTAVIAVGLFGSAGLAIDATRAWMVRSRLATSLDAAAISAARGYTAGMATGPTSDLARQTCAVFWANFGVSSTTNPCATIGGEGRGFLRATSSNPTIAVGSDNVLTVTAETRLDTTFMRLLGIDQVGTTAASAAIRTITSLEIALALDVTASMYPNGKIEGLRTAAQNFITSIYGTQETRENTYVSIVPYTTNVNIGTASYATAMVTQTSRNNYAGLYDNQSPSQPVAWRGCVEARYQWIGAAGTYGDLTDQPATPSDSGSQFRAWFYPTSLDASASPQSLYWRTTTTTSGGRNPTTTTNRYYVGGDNEWRSYVSGNTAINARAINEWALNQGTSRPGVATGTSQNPLDITGPHLGCLLEPRYEVLPLTAQRTTLLNRISGLQAEPWQWHYYQSTGRDSVGYGGTIIHLGLHMAWLTISPRWSGLWGSRQTTDGWPLPLATDRAGQKVIVLMTDGVNDYPDFVWAWNGSSVLRRGAPDNCGDNRTRPPRRPDGCPSGSGSNVVSSSINYTPVGAYGPYGRLADGNLRDTRNNNAITSSSGNAHEAELNRRLATLCTTIKNTGIHIYTVAFALGDLSADPTTVRTLLTNCATNAGDYFEASNAAALNAAFVEIANRVGRVRLVR